MSIFYKINDESGHVSRAMPPKLPAASIKPATSSAPPKFKSKTLVVCDQDSARPVRGVVIECNGSSIVVLDAKENAAITFSDDKVTEVKSSFAVVTQDCNGRTVRCRALTSCHV